MRERKRKRGTEREGERRGEKKRDRRGRREVGLFENRACMGSGRVTASSRGFDGDVSRSSVGGIGTR